MAERVMPRDALFQKTTFADDDQQTVYNKALDRNDNAEFSDMKTYHQGTLPTSIADHETRIDILETFNQTVVLDVFSFDPSSFSIIPDANSYRHTSADELRCSFRLQGVSNIGTVVTIALGGFGVTIRSSDGARVYIVDNTETIANVQVINGYVFFRLVKTNIASVFNTEESLDFRAATGFKLTIT